MADQDENRLARVAANCLGHGDGPEFLAGLRRLVDHDLKPDCTEGELRDLAGQRRLLRKIEMLVKRGLEGAPASFMAQTEGEDRG